MTISDVKIKINNVLDRKTFEGEFRSILRLLKEHGFLKYSGQFSAYEDKEKTAVYAFKEIVQQRTGVKLPWRIFCIDGIRDASINNARRIIKRGASYYKKEIGRYSISSNQRQKLLEKVEFFEKASANL